MRKVLLIEPNYKNKFPPIALMKLSTYFKLKGDDVTFYKGDFRSFVISQIADKCVAKLKEIHPDYFWESKRHFIIEFIRTRKNEELDNLKLYDFEDELLITNWILYYKDYYWKKKYLQEPDWDYICISTLFTFYYDITVKTINDFKRLLKPNGEIMIGGVLATLQSEDIENETGIKPRKGLLNQPGDIDPGDSLIIDSLPLDYTILDEIDYKYEMSDAYYGYLTRGCIRKCPFCAVPKLEPNYEDYIPLKQRILEVESVCGPQRNLLLMDNNILASNSFDAIIEEIIDCGFQKGATYNPVPALPLAIENLRNHVNDKAFTRKVQKLYVDFLNSLKDSDDSYKVYEILEDKHLLKFDTTTREKLLEAADAIMPIFESHKPHKRTLARTIDFNQGVDGRLFTPHIAKQLSRIAISPLRIAFDDIALREPYEKAVRMSADNGIKNFSNYLLYNFLDKPVDLFHRMRINVELCDELGINIYSFPMKYHPIVGEYSHNRNYIGKYWNRKYIRAVQAVLNSTKGMIGRGISYFRKAFGHTQEEYLSILEMPDTYIIYRFFFEWLDSKKHPLGMSNWVKSINCMTYIEQQLFFSIIHDNDFDPQHITEDLPKRVKHALSFYRNRRDDVAKEKGELYSLKKEFDTLPKESLEYIKNSFTSTIKFKRSYNKKK